MAQIVEVASTPIRKTFVTLTNEAVAVPAAGNTPLVLDFDVSQLSRVFVTLKNSGAQAFDALLISAKSGQSPNAPYVPIASVTADYTTPSGAIVKASGDLTVLGAGLVGWIILDVRGMSKLKIEASGNVAGATSAEVFIGGS